MTNRVKKIFVIVPVSLAVAFFAVCGAYHILVKEAFWPTIMFASFCFFFTSLFIVVKIVDHFFIRGKTDEKKFHSIFSRYDDNLDSINLNDFLTMKFDLPETSDHYFENLPDGKIFFAVADVEGNKVATDIIMKIIVDTSHSIKNPSDLQNLMKNLDVSIVLLNIKGAQISVITGIIDSVEMRMKFINASTFDIFSYQKSSSDEVHIPLISNRYKMASDKKLPFIAADYSLSLDDVVLIKKGRVK